MKKILLTLVLGIFLLSFASAEIQTLGTFKQDNSISLIQICASCTFNNITSVNNPNSFQIVGEQVMTKVGSVYNFTLSSGNTSVLGEYIVNGIGDLDGTNTIWTYNFFITADGKPFQAFPNEFAAIGLAFLLIISGLFNNRLNLLKHMGSIILMVMGVLTLYPGYNFINHTNLFGLSLGSILIGIGFYFLIEDSFSREEQADRFNQPQRRGGQRDDFDDDFDD